MGGVAGAGVAGTAGAAASQTQAYVQAYLQRLGGHLDEARRTLDGLQSGAIGNGITDQAARNQLIDSFAHRVGELEAARAAIQQAGPFTRPFQLAAHLDDAIARAALDNFTPAIPVDAPSLIFAAAGVIVGFVIWDMAGWPVRRAAAKRAAARR